MTYAVHDKDGAGGGAGAGTAAGTGPGAGQDNEKYFHIANKVISPRLGKPRQDKTRQDRTGPDQKQALCQAVLTLVKNHEHCQALLPPSLLLFPAAAHTPESSLFLQHPEHISICEDSELRRLRILAVAEKWARLVRGWPQE